MIRRFLSRLHVHVHAIDRRAGTLVAGAIRVPCALGRAGAGLKTREGDGLTPIGLFRLGRLHYRADRLFPPACGLAKRRIGRGDWWSDLPGDRAYNRLVTARPMPDASEERLWRQDGLYDLFVDIGFNDRPVVRGRGSGIFLHVARPAFTPSAGCVVARADALLRVLRFVGPRTRIRIGAGVGR